MAKTRIVRRAFLAGAVAARKGTLGERPKNPYAKHPKYGPAFVRGVIAWKRREAAAPSRRV